MKLVNGFEGGEGVSSHMGSGWTAFRGQGLNGEHSLVPYLGHRAFPHAHLIRQERVATSLDKNLDFWPHIRLIRPFLDVITYKAIWVFPTMTDVAS